MILAITKTAALMLICSSAMAANLSDFMPPSELRTIEVVGDYSQKYKAAANELQKSALWKERKQAMIKAAKEQKGDPKNSKWVGILEKMGTTSNGNAFIVVRIAQGITLSTWNNELSDINDKTLIKSGSKDYNALMNLKTGAVIKFTFAIDSDGKGLTEATKMTEPDFSTRFKDIEPMAGASAAK